MRCAAGALVCLAGFSLVLSAQQAPRQPPPTFQSGIDVVLLDVSVLDKQRRPVRGLTTEDFTILEDGKPRPIAAFTAVDLPGVPARADAQRTPAKASWTRDVAADTASNDIGGEGRLVVIMLDRTIELGFPTTAARRIAAAAIDQLAPNDLAAVVYTVNGAPPQNFTSDRARLLKALEGSPRGTELSDEAQEVSEHGRCDDAADDERQLLLRRLCAGSDYSGRSPAQGRAAAPQESALHRPRHQRRRADPAVHRDRAAQHSSRAGLRPQGQGCARRDVPRHGPGEPDHHHIRSERPANTVDLGLVDRAVQRGRPRTRLHP